MKSKPLLFQLLCILFLIEPIIKIVYLRFSTEFSLGLILNNILQRDAFLEIFAFWLAFPLAGLCLIKLRKWTYFIFLALLVYNTYVLLSYERYTWPYNSEAPFLYNYFLIFLSVLIMAFFLLPVIREPFFNARIRWWESRQRFHVLIPAKMRREGAQEIEIEITNISYSGALIKDTPELKLNEEVIIGWNFMGHELELPSTITRTHQGVGWKGYGVQFRPRGLKEKIALHMFIYAIEKEHLRSQSELEA